MAHITIEGYLCERCGYRWASRNGTGLRDKEDPQGLRQVQEPLLEQAPEEQPLQGPVGQPLDPSDRTAGRPGLNHAPSPPDQATGEGPSCRTQTPCQPSSGSRCKFSQTPWPWPGTCPSSRWPSRRSGSLPQAP